MEVYFPFTLSIDIKDKKSIFIGLFYWIECVLKPGLDLISISYDDVWWVMMTHAFIQSEKNNNKEKRKKKERKKSKGRRVYTHFTFPNERTAHLIRPFWGQESKLPTVCFEKMKLNMRKTCCNWSSITTPLQAQKEVHMIWGGSC